jgi:diacylglycerol kinase (ATP)
MSLLLLANPTSGGGKGAKLKDKVIAQLTLLGKEFIDISGTSYESALVNLRESKKRHQGGVVIVIGGDGMVHLAIQELASSNFAMLLIPAGTGNDFARSVGLSIDKPLDALDLGLREPAQRVDLGRVNDRFFAEILSTGFDSLVNERANRIHWQSKRKYDFAMLLELPFFKPLEYQIELDSRKFVTEAMLIAVANGASYGGGMKVCPDASLTDGFFDVMILEPVSKFEFLRVFPKVFKGTHITHPRVRIERARSVNISAPAVAYADGERIGPLPIKAEIAPNSLLTWIAS